jgi:hypothetical protein
VKFHPDGRNVSITVGKFPPTEADIDARNLETAIYNLRSMLAKLRHARLTCLR